MKRASTLLLLGMLAATVAVWFLRVGRDRWPESLTIRWRDGGAGAARTAVGAGGGAERQRDGLARPEPEEPAAAADTAADAVAVFDRWAARHLGTADAARRAGSVAEGVALAGARREALGRLIESDPEAALDAAVPWAVRRALPGEVDALLEERVDGVGDLDVIAALPGGPGDPDFVAVRREAEIEGRRYRAFVFGRTREAGTRSRTPIHGIAIGDRLAVDDAPGRVLEPGEPVPDGHRDETGNPGDAGSPTRVDLGDRVVEAPSPEEAGALAAGPGAEEAVPAGAEPKDERPRAETATTGKKEILIVRVRFSDQGAGYEPQDDASVLAMVEEVNRFFVENSFGALSVEATVTPVYTLPQTADWYAASDTSRYARNVLDAARAVAADPASAAGNAGLPACDWRAFDLDVVRYTGGPGAFTGQAFVGSRGCWLKTSDSGVLAHELGHNLGLCHANFWRPDDPETITGPGGNVEYADLFDTMGSSKGGKWHFNAYEKHRLGWIPAGSAATVAAAGRPQIAAHDLGGAFDSRSSYALRVRRDADRDIWLEFRRNPGWADTPWLLEGLGVRWDPWAASNGGSQLLDTTPFSPWGKSDAALVPGRTFHDPVAGVFLTPLGMAGGARAALEVDVRFGTPEGNRPPTVELSASAGAAAPGQAIVLTAAAADADGDALSYAWDFGDGSVGKDAAVAVKAWNEPGTRRVRVTASDRHGGTASAACLVRVGAPRGSCIGGVVRGLDGRPVPDVRVHNGAPPTSDSYRQALTDSRGAFVLTGVPEGSWELGATRPGWVFAQVGGANAATVPGDIEGADFAGWSTGFRITGTVRDAGGRPVAGALVGAGALVEPTGENGDFAIQGAAPGRHVLVAWKDGYAFAEAEALVPEGGLDGVTITERTWTLSGEVRGLPAGSVATVTDGWRSTTTYTRQTPAGPVAAFALPRVPAGRWHVRVVHGGDVFGPEGFANPVEVAGNRGGLVFVREDRPLRAIAGRVTDRGEGLAGVPVAAGGASTVTDSRGGYYLAGVAEGQQTVTVAAGMAMAPPERSVTIAGGEIAGQDFASARGVAAPVFARPPAPVSAADGPWVRLSAWAEDDGGAALVRYTWSVAGTPPAPVLFAVNGTHSAAETLARFAAPGVYRVRVTASDAEGASSASDRVVTVASCPARLVLGVLPASLEIGQTWQFSTRCIDGFGCETAPAELVAWRVDGGGTIDGTGWFTATEAAETVRVTATLGGVAASGEFAVVQPSAPPRIVAGPVARPAEVGASLGTDLAVVAEGDGGPAALTYTWSVAGAGAGPVAFLPNGSGAARETKARFARAGRYVVRVAVQDAIGRTAEATTEVVVLETACSWRARFFPAAQLGNAALERSVWGNQADPDGDGMVNLLEYAFDSNPLLPGVEGQPAQSFVRVGGEEYLAITFRRNRRASDIDFVPEASSDLAAWETGLVLVGDADGESVTYRDVRPARSFERRFLRVRVVER